MAGPGEVDTSIYNVPEQNPMAQANAMADLANKSAEFQQRQMTLQLNRFNSIGNAAASLLPMGANVTGDDVRKSVQKLVATGVVDPKTAAQYLTGLPADGVPLFNHLSQVSMQAIGAAKALEAQMGSLVSYNNGGGQQFMRLPGMPGPDGGPQMARAASGYIPNTLTPGEKASEVERIDQATAQPRRYFKGQLVDETGNARPPGTPLQYGQPGTGPQGAPVNPLVRPEPAVQPGPQPKAAGNPLLPPTGGAPQGGPQPGPKVKIADIPTPPEPKAEGLPTVAPKGMATVPGPENGLPPDDAKALADMGDYATNLHNRAAAAIGQQQNINIMRDALKQGLQTGGGAKLRQAFGQILQAGGAPEDLVNEVANGSLPLSQIFQKQNFLAAGSILNTAIGGNDHTNFQLQQAMERFPNIDTDPKAAAAMLKTLDTMARMVVDEEKGYTKYKARGGNPLEWRAKWNNLIASNPKGADGKPIYDLSLGGQ